MENVYVDFVLNAMLVGAGVQCFIIVIDFVLTSLLSQIGRG